MKHTQVQVRDLQDGDVLMPTNRQVVGRPTAGARTPAGKRDLTLRNLGGKRQGEEYRVTFGAYTRVSIIPGSPRLADAWEAAILAQRNTCHGNTGVHTPACIARRGSYCPECQNRNRVQTDDDKMYCPDCQEEQR